MEEVLKADSGQLHAEDSVYGGTPLHWAKTAEVNDVAFMFCIIILFNIICLTYLKGKNIFWPVAPPPCLI